GLVVVERHQGAWGEVGAPGLEVAADGFGVVVAVDVEEPDRGAVPFGGGLHGERPPGGDLVGEPEAGDVGLGGLAGLRVGEPLPVGEPVDGLHVGLAFAGEVPRVDGPHMGAVAGAGAGAEVAGGAAVEHADLDDGLVGRHGGG